jgi:hypothetical protein
MAASSDHARTHAAIILIRADRDSRNVAKCRTMTKKLSRRRIRHRHRSFTVPAEHHQSSLSP